MKIAIIGTGGVGGYFGGKIAKAGFDVTFFARGTHFPDSMHPVFRLVFQERRSDGRV